MTCAACGFDNPANVKFCGSCGHRLVAGCAGCGAENPPGFRFCGGCGRPLVAEPRPPPAPGSNAAVAAGARKVVTIVFADLIGSTSLHERLDPESVNRLMDRYYQVVREPVEAHGGSVVQLLGDGVMCAFGIPRAGEDDAIRAVRAAADIQRAFHHFARAQSDVAGDIGLRVAVNTGEVVVSDEHAAGLGDPINVAARLQQEGHDGDVLVSGSTQRLVSELVTLAPLGALALKGRAETVTAYRVVSLKRPAGSSATAFVGRDDELRRIAAVYDVAVAAPAGRLAVILGSPGLGKSRLVDEFARRLGDVATVLTAHCDAAGGATFAPIARALRTHLCIDDGCSGDAVRAAIDAALPEDDADSARIAGGIAALLAGTPGLPEETFFVVRRLLAALATARPVVLAIDDLHWAQPLLLDLVEHLVQWGAGVPLLVLAAARPELRDARSSLASPGGLVADVVTLAGLDAGAATRLAASVIGAEELPAAIAGRVLTTSEGNPLFVGELVRMLVNDGALKREGDRWTAGIGLAGLEMPPTIHALLAARIERLRPEERTVLERAAVVGRQFSRAAVAHLLPREAHGELDARLEALRRNEIIERDAAWFLGEPALRFHHVLTRDAAYRRLLKNTRAELHGRFADWLQKRVGDAVEHDETIGWHLEQAHQLLRELGPIDAQGRALGQRAARYLAAAGRRALARDDLPLAAGLLGRALDRLDATDPARADLALDWCEALLAAGDVGPAKGAIDELGRFTGDSERLRAWHTCFTGQLTALTDPQALRATGDAVAAAAETLASLRDAAGEAKAHFVHAVALARLGKVGACEAALDRALAAARRADDRRRSNAVLAGAPLAALWGPSPVTRASGRCLDVVRVLRITQGAPAVEAVALRCQGVLEALRGRTEAARRMIAASRHMIEELGITHRLLEADVFAGRIELLEGDAAAAERCLRPAYDGLREHGLGIDAAQAAALLGRALLAQGRAADAEALSHESEALAGDDLQGAIAWRGVRAEALARRGEHTSAVQFARAAVDIAAATDALLDHADARLALAVALHAAGRSDEAAGEEARAIELWEAKGATLLAERARRDGGRVARVDHALGELHPVRRRVQANAASAHAARLDAVIAARDADALPTLLADDLEVVHHPTGAEHGREGALFSARSLLEARDPTILHEPLATLGDSLGMYRMSVSSSGASEANDWMSDIGPLQIDQIILIEVDTHGRRRRGEIFAVDRLGDAVARLYERYADLLPDGPARARAAATARAVVALPLAGARDLDREAAAIAPALEYVDHRTVGLGSVHGAEAMRRAVGALLELSEDFTTRLDDILALRSDALLVRWTHFGTDRASGGTFERRLCHLWVFGVDGLVTRGEQWDADREDEALARFDELTAEPAAVRFAAPPRAVEKRERRVRANAATATAIRLDAAIAARDADSLPTLWADEYETVDHTTGTTWDLQGMLTSWRWLLSARDPMCRHELLATLGDSLALCRASTSASGFAGAKFNVGAYQREEIALTEVDAQGRRRRGEVFAVDRLGDAIARFYERYAELLPDGPARVRAAATARSVAALLGPPDRWPFAPDAEAMDHRTVGFGSVRGGDAVLEAIRALLQLSDDFASRMDDVLALRSDALLNRWTTSGTVRASGGAFERNLLMLWVFGPDGLLTRWEQFDTDREAEALARFDQLTAEPAAARFAPAPPRAAKKVAHRVRPNAATANAVRTDAAIAARDADALPTLCADSSEVMDHVRGVTFDRRGLLATFRSLLSARDPTSRHEPLATLGDALALCRLSNSATGFAGKTSDVGAYEREEVILIEVDAEGRRAAGEIFATDHLGDAIVRLYERYAEMLPDGPARARASATARSFSGIAAFELDRWAAAVAPAIEVVDHRTLGTWSGRGAEAFLEHLRALLGLADDAATRDHDVLALQPDALLVRRTHFGTARAGGGAYERLFLLLHVFAADGLVTRLEFFDSDREDEALARFDELTAGPAATRLAGAPLRAAERRRLRVQPNAATTNAARLDAAIAVRDDDTLPTLFADEYEVVDHTTGVTYDRQGELSSIRGLLSAQDPTHLHEPLATLGDSLALCRFSTSASRYVDRTLDVGAHEREVINLIEVDAQGRRRQSELFAPDRLADAVVRLYERHADLLPDGPARTRAAATARSVATMTFGRLDPDSLDAVIAPDGDYVDHRPLGFPALRGAEAIRRWVGSLFEVADDLVFHLDDVLALRSDAFLVRWTNFGTHRASGGSFERRFIALNAFGGDGLLRRWEFFEADRDTDALARFDELTAEPAVARLPAAPPRAAEKRARRVRANAATANVARIDAAVAARDAGALPALFADAGEFVEHPTRASYDRDGVLRSLRSLLRARDPVLRHEPLATLGDTLALFRMSYSASGLAGARFDVGAYETERFDIVEVDAEGRQRRQESFALDRLGDALVRLFERYAELLPDGPERARAATMSRSMAVYAGPEDLDRLAATLSPLIDYIDHRTIGMESTRGAEAFLRGARSLHEVADDVANRVDDVLALRPDAGLVRATNFGTDRAGGGAYERPFLAISVFGADGLLTRFEQFNADRDAEALARFDELVPSGAGETTGSRAVRFENAATRAFGRGLEALQARDWERFAALMAPGFDRDEWLLSYRSIVEMTPPQSTKEVLATRGDRLMLARYGWEGTDGLVGPSEIEYLLLIEVDGRGDHVAVVTFDPDALDAAYAELDARYVAGEAAPYARTWEAWLGTARAIATRDWKQLADAFAPGFIVEDHRPVRLLASLSGDEYVASARALVDLRPDVRFRMDHALALDEGRSFIVAGWVGSEPDGTFEIRAVVVTEHGLDGIRRWHLYDLDQLDAARACYGALAGRVPSLRIENAAMTLGDRFAAAWAARDWEGITAMFAPGFCMTDHRRYAHLDLDREQHLESLRFRFEMCSSRTNLQVLATRGHRFALYRQRFELADGDVGPSEAESLNVTESDEHGRFVALAAFDPDALDAAYAELDRRYAAGEGAGHGRVAAGMGDPLAALAKPNAATVARDRTEAAFEACDWAAMHALCAPDAKVEDRRRHALVSYDVDAWIADRQRWARSAVHQERRLVATAGDRVSLERILLTSGPVDGPSEFEHLRLTEVDESGRILASVVFDVDDWRAAQADAFARTLAVDPAATTLRPIYEFAMGFNDHDPARVRAAFGDDLIVQDDRLVGLGLLEGADAYLESLAALWRLAPDIRVVVAFELARERHGVVQALGSVGTIPEGGAFERPLVIVSIVAGGRITRMEFFEIEDVDAALARFAELRPDPLRIPPNAATRAFDRRLAASKAGDWEALEALCAPTLVFDDRRRGLRTTGGRDLLVANDRYVFSRGAQLVHRVLATAGDRLALQHHTYREAEGAAPFEIEALGLIEVDAKGRLLTLLSFDPDDRRAAGAELLDRYSRSEASRWVPAAAFEAFRAFNDHDLDRFRATLHEDFVFRDHRRTGVGTLERTDYLASIRPLFEGAPDVLSDDQYTIATEKHGSLSIGRDFGTLRDGGAFESVYARILLYQDDRIVAMEQYELEHLDVARARFEGLRAERP